MASCRRWAGWAALALVASALAGGAWAASLHTVIQKGRRFAVASITISRGDIIRFVNDDPFLHQAYIVSPTFNIDSNEQPPGQILDITFPVSGTFVVRCHIHPTMHLTVHVH